MSNDITNLLMTLAYIAIGYILGSITFGAFLAKLKGVDPRKHGSKNVGATNVSRVLGAKWGILIALLDAGKVVLAIYFCSLIVFNSSLNLYPYLIYVAGVGCVIGHCFPIFFKFKGGKGVACAGGYFIALSPYLAIIGLTQWFVITLLTTYVSVGSLMTVALTNAWMAIDNLNLFYIVKQNPANDTTIVTAIVCGFIIWAIIVYMHRSNIKRLMLGNERKVKTAIRFHNWMRRKPEEANQQSIT